MKILITGVAGFIGFSLAKDLMDSDFSIIGLDNINSYYDQQLKYDRLKVLGIQESDISWNTKLQSKSHSNFTFIKIGLEEREAMLGLFEEESFDIVINFAAQAGVRYSISHPHSYVQSNLVGFVNLLEACRAYTVKQFIYASSSSVYGKNVKIPFSVEDKCDQPISLYAATKKSNELIAHTYSHLFGISTIGLRFFTVYGPWGRPDMAYYIFANAISSAQPIKVFNDGKMSRDFTYISDIVDGIKILINNPSNKLKTHKVFNIGNGKPESLVKFIRIIEENMGQKAQKKFLEMQPGDVENTWADISELKELGYKSKVNVEEGIRAFINWYKNYHGE